MKLLSLLEKTEYTSDRDLSGIEIGQLCHDSRKACRESLFVAICGAAADGHDFARAAYDNGCRAFLCQRKVELPTDAVVIISPDTRKSLASLSATFFGHPADKMKIVGVTGTKGKTTTALMLASVFNAVGKSAGYIGSNGVSYGKFFAPTENTTPESYDLHYYFSKMLAAGVRYVFLEVSSQALYLSRVYGIEFDTVLFTNLAPDHIGGCEHPTFEHYKACKRSLFYDYNAKHAVINTDDDFSSELLCGGAKIITYALSRDADFGAENIEFTNESGYLGTRYLMRAENDTISASLRAPGYFSVYNALAAAAVARIYGIGLSDIVSALSRVVITGRFEFVPLFDDRIFVIDYCHNGYSLRAVLTALREYKPKRLVCLFGSVGGRTKGRRHDLGAAAAELADFSVITADNPDFEDPAAICAEIAREFADKDSYTIIPDRREALSFAYRNSRAGDIVLLAGKGHENYQFVRGEKQYFSEREILDSLPDESGETSEELTNIR